MASVSYGATGIDFSDYQTPTSVTGGSMAAELLDHYEEGTWDPNWGDGTMGGGAGYGFYIRIGTACTFNMYMTHYLNAGNSYQITGLPFTSISTSNSYSSCYFGQLHQIDKPEGYMPSAYINNNEALIVVYWVRDDSTQLAWTGSAIDNSGLGLMLGGHYRAA